MVFGVCLYMPGDQRPRRFMPGQPPQRSSGGQYWVRKKVAEGKSEDSAGQGLAQKTKNTGVGRHAKKVVVPVLGNKNQQNCRRKSEDSVSPVLGQFYKRKSTYLQFGPVWLVPCLARMTIECRDCSRSGRVGVGVPKRKRASDY